MYRVDAGPARYAAKYYELRRLRTGERVANEWRALTLFCDIGMAATPKPICHDVEHGLLVMEWVEGVPIETVAAADVDAALSFIERIFSLSGRMPRSHSGCALR